MKGQFTIRQVCQCCEVSRATILRMEQRGLLTPAFVDPRTGYRYYDAGNIARILHIRMFLQMGLSYEDAALYFRSEGKSRELLRSLEERLSSLKRAYDAMDLRINDGHDRQLEILRLPEVVCYQKEFRASSPGGRSRGLYETFREAVEQGCRPLISEHLFTIDKWMEPRDGEDGAGAPDCDYICCVPLKPECAGGHTVPYPACTVISMLCYGAPSAVEEVRGALFNRVRSLGLRPSGFPRTIAIVSGCTDESFRQENYVSRLAVPIQDLSGEKSRALGFPPAEGG